MRFLFFWITVIFFSIPLARAVEVPITLFPIEHYNQTTDTWVSPKFPAYSTTLLTPTQQQIHMQRFLNEYLAPWNSVWVNKTLIKLRPETKETEILTQWSKTTSNDKIGYKQNFRPYDASWFNQIANNMNTAQFSHVTYDSSHRAIVVKNTNLRSLPTRDPMFYRFDLPGEGYPFDNLQEEALWIGLPVYIVGESKDKAWLMVIVADAVGWVEADSIARTSEHFVHVWETAARHQLLAITHTDSSIESSEQQFLFNTYVGTVLPMVDQTKMHWKIDTPYRDSQGKAHIRFGFIKKQAADLVPLAAIPKNFAKLFKTLQQRPYGWGGLNFYNDCALELRNLFTPFGVALPYYSKNQLNAGKVIDITQQSPQERLSFLMQHGKPFMTIVHISGHVFLYIGNFPNPNDPQHALMPMTYQNIWGLKYNHEGQLGRAVIGQAAFIPLLLTYPEDSSLVSLLANKEFQLVYLN